MAMPGGGYSDALSPGARRKLLTHVLAVRSLRREEAVVDEVAVLEAERLATSDIRRAASAFRGLAEAARTRRDIENAMSEQLDAMAHVLEEAFP